MDYAVTSDRWRTRALLLGAIAALELAVLLVVGAIAAAPALVGGVETAARDHQLAPAKPRPRPAASKRPLLPRGELSVVVLNGNGVSGAAAASAARVRALTYVVSNVGNAPRSDYTRSMVMYRPGYRREAARLAKEVGAPLVGPLDGLRESDLMGAHLALVVGR